MRNPFRRTAGLNRYSRLRAIQHDRLVRTDGVPIAVLEVRPTEIELTSGQEKGRASS